MWMDELFFNVTSVIWTMVIGSKVWYKIGWIYMQNWCPTLMNKASTREDGLASNGWFSYRTSQPICWWWASSSDTLIYHSIFTFPLLPLHHWSTIMHPHIDATTHNHTCTCTTIALTSYDQSHLFDGHMFYDSHILFLFLVSTMCAFLWSNQSWTLTPCSQALTIALLWMSLMLAILFAIHI